ncbi:hypothetical protein ACVWZR_002727 [Bradyrhizobium sp. i1.3.1]
MRLTTGPLAARPLRDLLATTGTSVNMPSVTVPTFAGPSVAMLGGAMVASVGMPFVGASSVSVTSLTMPCALRTLARAARPALSLLRRGRTRIAAPGIGAVILTR